MRALALTLGLLAARAVADPPPLRVVMLSYSLEYDSHASLARLSEHLAREIGAVSLVLEAPDEKSLPGLEALDTADVLLVFTRRLQLPPAQLRPIQAWCEAGKPVVGIRTASHAFQTWLEFDRLVLGGGYNNHTPQSDAVVEVALNPKAATHPVLTGVAPFETPGTLYKQTSLADDTTVLLTGTHPERTEPVAWVRDYRGGRVFYTSLGHPADFEQPSFLRLLTNAVGWTSHRLGD